MAVTPQQAAKILNIINHDDPQAFDMHRSFNEQAGEISALIDGKPASAYADDLKVMQRAGISLQDMFDEGLLFVHIDVETDPALSIIEKVGATLLGDVTGRIYQLHKDQLVGKNLETVLDVAGDAGKSEACYIINMEKIEKLAGQYKAGGQSAA